MSFALIIVSRTYNCILTETQMNICGENNESPFTYKKQFYYQQNRNVYAVNYARENSSFSIVRSNHFFSIKPSINQDLKAIKSTLSVFHTHTNANIKTSLYRKHESFGKPYNI